MIQIFQTKSINEAHAKLADLFDQFNTSSLDSVCIFPSNRWKDDFTDFALSKSPNKTLNINFIHSYTSFLNLLFIKARILNVPLQSKTPISPLLKSKLLEEELSKINETLNFFDFTISKKANKALINKIDNSIKSLMLQGFSPDKYVEVIEKDDVLNSMKNRDLGQMFNHYMETIYTSFYDDTILQYDLVKYMSESILFGLNSTFKNIYFIGFDKYNPTFFSLIEKMSNLGCNVTLIIPGHLNDEALTHTKAYIRVLKNNNTVTFHEPIEEDITKKHSIAFSNFDSIDAEINGITQKIIDLNVQDGVELNHILVTFNSIENIQNKLKHKFEYHNIPFNMTTGIDLHTNKLVNHFITVCQLLTENFSYLDIIAFMDFAHIETSQNKNEILTLLKKHNCYQGYEPIFNVLEKYGQSAYLEPINFLKSIDIHAIIALTDIEKQLEDIFEKCQFIDLINALGENNANLSQSFSRAFYKLLELIQNLVSTFMSMRKFEMSFKEFITHLRDEINEATYQIPNRKGVGVQIMPFLEARSVQSKVVFIAGLNQSAFPNKKQLNTIFNDYELIDLYDEIPDNSIYEDIFLFDVLMKKNTDLTYLSCSCKDSKKDSPSFLIRNYIDIEQTPSWQNVDITYSNYKDISYQSEFKKQFDAGLGEKSIAAEFSATRLQTYFDCSYKYYLKYLLRFSEDKDDEIEIGNLELGNLIHMVLYDFHIKIHTEKIDDIQTQKTIILECLDSNINKLENEYPDVFDELSIDLVTLAKNEAFFDNYLDYLNSREDSEFIPSYFEWTFSEIHHPENFGEFESINPVIETSSGSIKIKGSIDRIDINPSSKEYTILDYKFKSETNSKEKSEFNNNSYLQIPIYIMILERLFKAGYRLKDAQIILLKSDSKMVNSIIENNKDLDIISKIEEYKSIVDDIIANIKQSKYVLNPRSSEMCSFCDFLKVCRIKEITV